MASIGKQSSTTGISAQGSKKARRSLLSAVLSPTTMANRAPNSSMGFESLPPLPITLVPFQFLKSLDLGSSGMGLGAVPSCFEWELVEWKPLVQQSRAEIGGKPTEVFGGVHDVVKIGDDTSEEGKIDLNLGTGDVHVHEIGGSGSVFED